MAESGLQVLVKRVAGWFLPFISLERIAYILHRVTGLYLAIYLPLHIISTHNSLNPVAWSQEMALYSSPLVKIGEVFLVFSVFYHGLNGIRLLLVEYFNACLPREMPASLYLEKPLSLSGCQRTLLYTVFIVSIVATILGTLYLLGLVRLG